MKNSLYLAVGNGGGRWSETKGSPLTSYMKDSQIDWDAIVAANMPASSAGASLAALPASAAGRAGSEDSSQPSGVAAQNILSQYMAGHTQVGAISFSRISSDSLVDTWRRPSLSVLYDMGT